MAENIPEVYCEASDCGKQLVRLRYKNGQKEKLLSMANRRSCDDICKSKVKKQSQRFGFPARIKGPDDPWLDRFAGINHEATVRAGF